jgi:hypothetical protein
VTGPGRPRPQNRLSGYKFDGARNKSARSFARQSPGPARSRVSAVHSESSKPPVSVSQLHRMFAEICTLNANLSGCGVLLLALTVTPLSAPRLKWQILTLPFFHKAPDPRSKHSWKVGLACACTVSGNVTAIVPISNAKHPNANTPMTQLPTRRWSTFAYSPPV